MQSLKSLTCLVGGGALPERLSGPASRTRLALRAAAVSAVLASLYGLAVAGGSLTMILGNSVKLPMVVLLSALSALPATLLAWKMTEAPQRASDLVVGLAAGVLTGTLVLAVLSPLVALYYSTTTWMGPTLAMATAGLALFVGQLAMVRYVVRTARFAEDDRDELTVKERLKRRAASLVPPAVLAVVQMLTLVQLIGVASPILEEQTAFDGGMERVLERR